MRNLAAALLLAILLPGSFGAGCFGVLRQATVTSGRALSTMSATTPDGNATCILPGCGTPLCAGWAPLCPVAVRCATLAGNPAAMVTYSSNSTTANAAVAYAVVINNFGTLVYATTSSFTVAPNSTATAFLLIEGLPPGNYTTTVFPINPSTGLVISLSVVLTCPFFRPASFPLGTRTLTLAEPLSTSPSVANAPSYWPTIETTETSQYLLSCSWWF